MRPAEHHSLRQSPSFLDFISLYQNQTPESSLLPNQISVKISPTRVEVIPLADTAVYFTADVCEKIIDNTTMQVLSMTLRTKDADKNTYSPLFPKGQHLVDNAVAFFDTTLPRPLDAFLAIWMIGTDNYAQFTEAKKKGLSDAVAATKTWSGKYVAQKHGFNEDIAVYPQVTEEGVPFIGVLFSRHKKRRCEEV